MISQICELCQSLSIVNTFVQLINFCVCLVDVWFLASLIIIIYSFYMRWEITLFSLHVQITYQSQITFVAYCSTVHGKLATHVFCVNTHTHIYVYIYITQSS